MACKVDEGKKYRIVTVQIAIDDSSDTWEDEMSAHLTENGICDEDSAIADWQYINQDNQQIVEALSDEEGEIFDLMQDPLERIKKLCKFMSEDGTFDDLASDIHPDIINGACDDLMKFETK